MYNFLQDVVDRTFHEMGVGSLKNLVVYYQNSIENYKIKKLKEVKDELRVCENTMDKMKEEQRQINGRSIMYVIASFTGHYDSWCFT